jgi:hypothetical protein
MPEPISNAVEVNYIANFALFVYTLATSVVLSVLLSAHTFECLG